MEDAIKRIHLAYESIRKKTDFIPDTAIVLGSGLGDYADSLDKLCQFEYGDIPGFPVSTAIGHAGRLIFAERLGKKIVVFQGRFHCYEGYSPAETVIPLRTVIKMGVKNALFTNAVGGINKTFAPGDLMLVEDHINFSGLNVLTGSNAEEFGTRFPDMSFAYSKRLAGLLEREGNARGILLKKGVYGYMVGPSYETPAEIRALSVLGADVVGMSTVHEVVASAHAGVETAVISCISNLAAGVLERAITHEEVMEAGRQIAGKIALLADGFIKSI